MLAWLLNVLLLICVIVSGDDSNAVDSYFITIGAQKWQTYNFSMIDWEPPEAQIPWVTVYYRTIPAPGKPLQIYAAIGEEEPTFESPFKTNDIFIDPVAGMTTVTLYVLSPPTDGGDLQIGVYNPNSQPVSAVNVTLLLIPDTEILLGSYEDESMDVGTYQVFHLDVTQAQIDGKMSMYFGVNTEDVYGGLTLYVKYGDYALPNRYDLNVTWEGGTGDVELMYIWIPHAQLKVGNWYFYLTAADVEPGDGDDGDEIPFALNLFMFEDVQLTAGQPFVSTPVRGSECGEFFLLMDAGITKNSPVLVDVTFAGVSYKDVHMYANSDSIATSENHDYQTTTTDKNNHLELVIPPGIGSTSPKWYFQVANDADPSNDSSINVLTFSITANFFPISSMSYANGLYELQSLTIPAGSYYYVVTHDLDEKSSLARLIVTIANATQTNVLILGTPVEQEPDRSLPTYLRHSFISSPLDNADGTVTFCNSMHGSVSQPVYLAIYNAGSSPVSISSVTLDWPATCESPFVTPSSDDHDGDAAVGFGGLGKYGLVAVIAGGVLTTFFAICCMHRWLKTKDRQRGAAAHLQSRDIDEERSTTTSSKPRKSKKSSKKSDKLSSSLLNNDGLDDDRVTAVEDL